MKSKKISMILGSVLGVIGFMLSIGTMLYPVSADDEIKIIKSNNDNISFNSNYVIDNKNELLGNYNDYSTDVKKSVTQNGLKVTLDKVVGTKHKLKVIVKVENEKAFDKEKDNHSIVQATYGECDCDGEGTSFEHLDDKTLLITIEQDSNEGFPENGELRVDLVLPSYKVNVGIDAAVDFSESFNNTIEKDICAKVTEFNFTLNKLESNILGTQISYSEPRVDHLRDDNDEANGPYSSMILKVGDKMYQMRSGGSLGDENETKGIYEAESATYDKVKDQTDISVIPVVCHMSSDEINKMYENYSDRYSEEIVENRENTNNVSYVRKFEFSDGTMGEIYKIERNNNTVKVYCKGTSEKESLLMANNMYMYYDSKEDSGQYIRDLNNYKSFYKDSNDEFGYVVEFDNVIKDKATVLNIDMIKQIDKYKLGDPIKLSK